MDKSIFEEILEEENQFRFKFKSLIKWVVCLLVCGAFFFREVPGLRILTLFFSAGFSVFSFFCAFKSHFRHALSIALLGLSSSYFLFIVWGSLFNTGYPFNWMGVLFFLGSLSFFALIEYIRYKNDA